MCGGTISLSLYKEIKHVSAVLSDSKPSCKSPEYDPEDQL